jgi:hypothetical protein
VGADPNERPNDHPSSPETLALTGDEPTTGAGLWQVVLVGVGADPAATAQALSDLLGFDPMHSAEVVDRVAHGQPEFLATGVPGAEADRLVHSLRARGCELESVHFRRAAHGDPAPGSAKPVGDPGLRGIKPSPGRSDANTTPGKIAGAPRRAARDIPNLIGIVVVDAVVLLFIVVFIVVGVQDPKAAWVAIFFVVVLIIAATITTIQGLDPRRGRGLADFARTAGGGAPRGGPLTKTVRVRDQLNRKRSDRAIQREIDKQARLGYELVQILDNRGAFAGATEATLVFRRKG